LSNPRRAANPCRFWLAHPVLGVSPRPAAAVLVLPAPNQDRCIQPLWHLSEARQNSAKGPVAPPLTSGR